MNIGTTTRQSLVEGGWFNLVLGMWVIVSPFVLGFERNTAAMWSNIAVGTAVVLLALAGGRGRGSVHWLIVPLGVWLFLSSFVLAFWNKAFVLNNVIVTFLVIGGAAGTDAFHEANLSGKSAHQE
ncbi:MAG TPA: SPW repeat protein [Candidatus Dormibacteraeota bacterium]|nr:SPW repeat protein [Candidatus Dormibacteraeota bacterium]